MKSEEELKKIFADNLNRLIEKKGMNQVDIAKKLNVSPARFNSWAKAKAMPRTDVLEALTVFFGVSRSELLEEECRPVTDRELKLTLFGSVDASDSMLEDVKKYARFLMQR